MRKTTALILLSLTASAANAAPADWSKVKPVDEPDMTWMVVEHPDGLKAMFAIPESDGGLLWMDCAGKGALTLTYVDSKLEPHTPYEVHLKSGTHETAVAAKTDERMDLDDLVFLTTAKIKDKPFIASLKKGKQLSIIIDHATKGRFAAERLPPHGAKLKRFFKACKL